MTIAKQCNDVHANILAQMIVHRLLTQYDFRLIWNGYAGFTNTNASNARWLRSLNAFCGPYRTRRGLFVWCDLPKESIFHEFTKQLCKQVWPLFPVTISL
jgi:hypothetical protein